MAFGSEIHNYYEQLVADEIYAQGMHLRYEDAFIADLSCLVLNQLPPRYIRYMVDMAFFLTSQEREEMRVNVAEKVQSALTFLENKAAD